MVLVNVNKHHRMSKLAQISIPVEFQAQFDLLTRKVEYLASQLKSQQAVPKKEWYRPTEVCQLMGISRSKFEVYKRSGLIPVRRVGKSVYVAASEISRLINSTPNS